MILDIPVKYTSDHPNYPKVRRELTMSVVACTDKAALLPL